MLNNIKRISIKDVTPNMVLAKDAVTKTGLVIIAKNTMLSNVNYKKLAQNGIKFISVFHKEDNSQNEFDTQVQLDNEACKKIQDRTEFKKFEKTYETKISQLENQFIAIGKGIGIKIDDLYDMVIDVLNNVNCKNDVFNYLANLKKYDIHTYAHSLNVGIICNLFGLWIGLDKQQLKNLTLAGIMHDIGKTKVEENLINKPGKLTNAEYENVKKHAYLGYKLVENLQIPEEIKHGILMHHEKIDGSGYPLGLKEDRISMTAKIVAICDIYEAMTADRVYRPRVCPFEVIRNFEQNSYNILDTALLLSFLQNIAYTYVGSSVMLSNGEEAEVVFINQSDLSRPIVRTNSDFLDLAKNRSITINHIL